MKMNKKIIALTEILICMTGWAGDSAPFLLDTIIDDALIEKYKTRENPPSDNEKD